MDSTMPREGALDRVLGRTVAVNWEMVAWIAIVVITLATRLYGLGDRAMSHDESLHTFYSWKLFDGQGYQHDPMMHGPLLYHATALSYWLFGVSDATARMLGVVTGLLLVLSPLLVRKWLGPIGAIAAGVMLMLSPTVMYYSRYIRHDIPVELFTALLAFSFVRYLDRREPRWVVLAFLAVAGAVTTAEMSYINMFVLASFVAVALVAERLARRSRAGLEWVLLGAGVAVLAFSTLAQTGNLASLGNVATEGSPLRIAMQVGFLASGLLIIYGLVSPLLSRVPVGDPATAHRSEWRLADAWSWGVPRDGAGDADPLAAGWRLAVIGVVVVAAGAGLWALPMRAAQLADRGLGTVGLVVLGIGWLIFLYGAVARLARGDTAQANLLAVAIGLVSGAGLILLASFVNAGAVESTGSAADAVMGNRAPVVAMAVAGLVLALLGVLGRLVSGDDTVGMASALREVPMEAVAAGLVLFAVVYTLLFTTFFTNAPGINGFFRSVEYWLEQHEVVRGGQPWYYYAIFTPMYEFAPLLLSLAGAIWYVRSPARRVGMGNDSTDPDRPAPAAWAFVPMLMMWAMGNFWIYSWAGEKMPWLIVHLVVPLAILAGRVIGDLVDLVDVEELRARGWAVAGLTLVLLAALVWWVLLAPSAGKTQAELASTSSWLVGAVLVAVIAWALWSAARPMPRRQAVVAASLALAGALMVINTRYSLAANFQNDELATEYIVYAHGTPDDKYVFDLLKDMQSRLGIAEQLTVGYDNEVSWPFTWYFRDAEFPGAQYLGEKPSGVLQLDAVLVGSPNYPKFEPFLRDRYVSAEFRRMWWPNEGYKGLNLDWLLKNITDPKLRRNWLNILLYREYTLDPQADQPQPKPLNDWYHHANMRLYVRKDLIKQLWPLAQARPDWVPTISDETDESYASAELQIEQTFTTAPDDKPIIEPKDVAVDAEGRVYVVDHGQYRVVVFGADGAALQVLADGELRAQQAEEGQTETQPSAWGIGVGPGGEVYVADTWNHRVLKFVGGARVGEFGRSGTPTSPDAEPELLFGPRDVAVAPDGLVYVTDTGNDRIIVLDADLVPIRAFGGSGIDPGQFDEPTSLAFDPETGDLYVADVWNLRVQRFDRELRPSGSFTVDGWEGKDAAHKAYIAVGPGSVLVASDPSAQRVWVWDRDGKVLTTLDLPADTEGLDLPIGVAVDAEGRVYVASTNSGLVTRYGPLAATRPGGDSAGASGPAAPSPTGGEAGPSPTGGEAGPTSTGGDAGPTAAGGDVGPTTTGGGAGPTATTTSGTGGASAPATPAATATTGG